MFGSAVPATEAGEVEAVARVLIGGPHEGPPGGWGDLPPEMGKRPLDNARALPPVCNAPGWERPCGRLGRIDTPARVAHGEDSQAFWATLADGMAERLPPAELAPSCARSVLGLRCHMPLDRGGTGLAVPGSSRDRRLGSGGRAGAGPERDVAGRAVELSHPAAI